jgi:hypothetical protein
MELDFLRQEVSKLKDMAGVCLIKIILIINLGRRGGLSFRK